MAITESDKSYVELSAGMLGLGCCREFQFWPMYLRVIENELSCGEKALDVGRGMTLAGGCRWWVEA
jgi:hypothetical protein